MRNRRASKRPQPPPPASSSTPPLLESTAEPKATSGTRNTLILFEGPDTLLDEDRGFLSALCDLIEESKVRCCFYLKGRVQGEVMCCIWQEEVKVGQCVETGRECAR